MPFNISSYKANGPVYGLARPSQFKVFLTVPGGLGISPASVTKFSFACNGAELPPAIIGSINAGYFGRFIKLAGDRTFPDWEVQVQNDEDFSVRALFETWSNAINRLVANVRDLSIAIENYKVDLEVKQYSKDGIEIRSYIMVGAWPSTIGPISLKWDDQNAVEMFGVNFCYDYWIPNTEQSVKNAGGSSLYGDTIDTDGPVGGN